MFSILPSLTLRSVAYFSVIFFDLVEEEEVCDEVASLPERHAPIETANSKSSGRAYLNDK